MKSVARGEAIYGTEYQESNSRGGVVYHTVKRGETVLFDFVEYLYD